MRIVVLDGYVINPGDITWERLQALGETVIYDRTPAEEIISRCKEAEAVLVGDVHLSRETLQQLPKLKYVGVLATGYNIVDVRAARELGIVVTNVPNYSTSSVAQSTIALLLELCHRTGAHSDAVRSGAWGASQDYCFWNYPLIELHGKTMGIIGYGRIGSTVANIAKALGMNILVYARKGSENKVVEDVTYCDLNDLLAQSDVVSLHCPLTDETAGMIHKGTLELMKPSAFLLNVSRGPIVVEEDLAFALNTGRIAGAGLDVLSTEPPQADNPLLSAMNCIITPHIAWAPVEARTRLVDVAADNLACYLSGQPVNVVSGI